ncbi:hypothetical protein L4D76_25765 [Photobacterium sagamiensis]|uniref:hypothetical protein n=1 Tax=Photobacterium sagamiensis TaxID=2910241 RepID=UPI003D0AAF42
MRSNFYFLEQVSPQLYQIAVAAERNLHRDPHTTLFKVRLLSEEIIRFIAQLVNLDTSQSTFELIKQLGNQGLLDEERQQIFHALRKAAHGFYNNQVSASHALQIARRAAKKAAGAKKRTAKKA